MSGPLPSVDTTNPPVPVPAPPAPTEVPPCPEPTCAPSPPTPPPGGVCARAPCTPGTERPAGGVLHDAAVYAQNGGAGFGSPDVGIGNIQVVTGDRDIEVVFERQGDRVVHRDINFAVVQELVDARRVGHVRRRYAARRVGRQQVGEGRRRFRVLLHVKRLRLRRHGLLGRHRGRGRAGHL